MEPIKPKPSDVQTSLTFDMSKFSKDVIVYIFGQVILSFFPTFIIAKYLSMVGYGYWQIFLMYGNFVGILHLGFLDGVLVRWAGKDITEIGNETRIAFRFLLLELIIIITPLGFIVHYLFHPPFQWLGTMILIYAFIMCLMTYFIFINQALKKFKLLTLVNIIQDGCFLLFAIVLKISGYFTSSNVIWAYSASYVIVLFGMILLFWGNLWGKNHSISSLWTYGGMNINIGIFILFGNFVSASFLTIDRLMVNNFFPIQQFAIYAFALSIALISNTLTGTISLVLFPYISNTTHEIRNRAFYSGKSAFILLWAFILVLYFPIGKLVEYYLPAYTLSLPIIRILVCTISFGGLIQILHVNYYKVYGKQRLYFAWGLTLLIMSVLLNFLVIKIWGTLESIAIVMLVLFGIWYIINELCLKSSVGESNCELWKSLAIILSYMGAYWITFLLAKWFLVQMMIYLGCFCLITWLFLRQQIQEYLAMAIGLMKGNK